ncbi:MAG: hypothetical protein H0V66_13235 [Bdellovibrionales bacterium]|nr:hypothetical protein [Bdellovibrionales bacterium]
MKKKELTKKEMEEKAKQTLNYNDRLDGYGMGEADKEDKHSDEEKGMDEEEASRYGEVDQYSFRVKPLGGQQQSEKKTEREADRKP